MFRVLKKKRKKLSTLQWILQMFSYAVFFPTYPYTQTWPQRSMEYQYQ